MKTSENLLTAFSLAALCFIRVWSEILGRTWYFDYPGFFYQPSSILIALFWMLILTLLLTFLFANSSNRFSLFFIGMFTLFALNGIRLELGIKANYLIFYVLIGSVLLIRFRSHFFSFFKKSLFTLSPFAFLIVGRALWDLASLSAVPLKEPKSIIYNQNAPRIVWMIFDAFDIRLAFENRGSLQLPHLEQFCSQSLYATEALAAGSNTLQSIPAMISGLNIISPKILNDRTLEFTKVETQEKLIWNDAPNIFSKARSKGLCTAVLGNYHPYKKIFSEHADFVLPSCLPSLSFSKNFIEQSLLLFQSMADCIPLIRRLGVNGESLARQKFIDSYLHLKKNSLAICSDPHYKFVFIHWTVPHYPGIYHSESKTFIADYPSNYIDSLILVDDTLGEIYQEMQQSGTWDSTTVIVTSDHWARKVTKHLSQYSSLSPHLIEMMQMPDYRVPFIVKMPYQNKSFVHSEKFRLYDIHRALEHIMDEKIRSPEDLISWMKLQEDHADIQGLSYF